MSGIKLNLNAQVQIRNLRKIHEKSLPARRRMQLGYQDWAPSRLPAEDHTRADMAPARPSSGMAQLVD
jgi:hypothetical protein